MIVMCEFSGKYRVVGIKGRTFSTRAAAERALAQMQSKERSAERRKERLLNPSVTVSFAIGMRERDRLIELASKRETTLSKLIRTIVEKEVQENE